VELPVMGTLRVLGVGVALAMVVVGCTPSGPRTERVSVTSDEAQGNGNDTGDTAISEDGQTVAFVSRRPVSSCGTGE
jgi:hypothetical protein